MAKTVREREDEIRSRPVEYNPNGTVKLPVTWAQLLDECIRLKKELDNQKGVGNDGEM